MLHEFIALNRDAIIARTRERVEDRKWPSVTDDELENGVPLFLTQLAETLRLETTDTPFPSGTIASSAARHGGAMLGAGFNVSQVVHDYGDICQAITGLASEQHAPITVHEFQTLNRSLDTAIAEAVTEHARVSAQAMGASVAARQPGRGGASAGGIEQLGQTAHELRDLLNSAILAFHMLKRGIVAINGTTGAVLGRSLMSLRNIVDRTLTEVRLTAVTQRRERLPVITLLDEIAAAAVLDSDYRGIVFALEPVDPRLAVDGDAQLLSSALMNLLHNAFKYTHPGGRVVLRARAKGQRLVIEVEDECGGIPESKRDPFEAFADRRGTDRSGLGLGLSMARKAIRSHGGDISVRNMPGTGCVFAVELPLAAEVNTAAPVLTKDRLER